jgi:hypothetical protein
MLATRNPAIAAHPNPRHHPRQTLPLLYLAHQAIVILSEAKDLNFNLRKTFH